MRGFQDPMMKRFEDIRIPRCWGWKRTRWKDWKTKGFFQVQKLPALWNSDHAALTLPKICFLENFSEYPPSPPKATDLPYLKRGDKFLENLILSEWKLQPPPKIGGKTSKKIKNIFQTVKNMLFAGFLEASRYMWICGLWRSHIVSVKNKHTALSECPVCTL